MMKLVIALCLIGISAAYVVPVYYEIYPEDATFDEADIEPQLSPAELHHGSIRERRSLQPGAPSLSQLPTSVSGNVEKQGRPMPGNTIATIDAQHKTDRYDVRGTVDGPGRSKPNFRIGGSWTKVYRW
nr:holotricin 2 precursor - Holotrichia diomphalia [Holotrichia diomphalia]